MYYKTIKKEIKKTISRKKKFIYIFNTNLYSLNIQYNFLIFFSKHYNLKLNNKVIINLIREELGFFYSFNNWLYQYYKKIY